MKRQKNISDLFRDNQHKLDERPSADAWDRLERKLDRHQTSARRQVRPMYRNLIMAASILFLVGMVSFLSLFLKQDKASISKAMNAPSYTPVPTDFEDITYTDANDGLYKMVNYSKNLNTNPRKVIQEGTPYKKLVAQRTNSSGFSSNTEYAQINKLNKEKENTSFDYNNQAPTNDGVIAMNNEIIENSNVIVSGNDAIEEESTPIPTPTTSATYKSQAPPITNDAVDEENAAGIVHIEAKRTTAAKDAANHAKARMKTFGKAEKRSESQEDMVLNVAKNQIGVSADKSQLGLNQFQWILGNWKNQSPLGQSLEAWKQLDEFTIQGKGFLVVNGDTTFTESMNIQKIDQDLYYVLAVDAQGQQQRYKLKTYTEKEVIFENNNIAFPNQVILQRTDSKNFTTVLQNSQAPTQLNASQNTYLRNRNQIRPEQVERVMTKTQK